MNEDQRSTLAGLVGATGLAAGAFDWQQVANVIALLQGLNGAQLLAAAAILYLGYQQNRRQP